MLSDGSEICSSGLMLVALTGAEHKSRVEMLAI